jgi:hypothetical protein
MAHGLDGSVTMTHDAGACNLRSGVASRANPELLSDDGEEHGEA